MGTSIGKAVDWLVSTLTTAVAAADSTATVADGWPSALADGYVVIGRESPDSGAAADGQQSLMVLGLGSAEEDYSIPCHIQAMRPGPAMKPARDAAILLFDTVAHAIAADRTLGGALLGGRFAQISKVVLTQQQDNESQTAALREVTLSFEVHCQNHYQP